MKAETAIEISNKNGCTFVEGTTSEHWIRAMHEYARIQIEKDRSETKRLMNDKLKDFEGLNPEIEAIIDRPIILD
jgi:hypothetical protein